MGETVAVEWWTRASGGPAGNDGSSAITEAVAAVEPLATAVGGRPRVHVPDAPEETETLQRLLDRVADRSGWPSFEVTDGSAELTSSELAISARLGIALRKAPLRAPAPDEELARAIVATRTALPTPRLVRAQDGTPLRCYEAGDQERPVIVIVMACGMPVGLSLAWMRELARTFRVITWETRNLFGGGPGDTRHDFAAQVGDLESVLAHFDVDRAHVMGLCDGAPIALAAAESPRVRSLSLWHGDYELGDEAPRTTHQRDIRTMLAMVTRGESQAKAVHRLFQRRTVVDGMPAELAHLLVYPYATFDQFQRYTSLSGEILSADCRPMLTRTIKPCLVATSERDETTHPEASVLVSERLPRARLLLLPDKDHLVAFAATPRQVRALQDFVD